jgi:hypothetical protein
VHADVRAIFTGLSPKVRGVVSALRAVVRRTAPEAEETILWGGLSYHRPDVGGRVKGAVCIIVVKKGKVRLDFIHGIRLADPSGILQGQLLSKRYVLMETIADTKRPEIEALIHEAAALDPRTWAESDTAADAGRGAASSGLMVPQRGRRG